MTPKREKTKCANCGDEFAMATNAVGERVKLNWCVGCYTQRAKGQYTTWDGRQVWTQGPGTFRRNPYGGKSSWD